MSTPVANIGPDGRRSRFVLGVLVLVLAAAAAVALSVTGCSRWTRSLLAIPFLLGSLGVLQARERVCVVHAHRGTRELGEGAEPIEDPAAAAEIRRRAARVWARCAAAAAIFTAGALLLP